MGKESDKSFFLVTFRDPKDGNVHQIKAQKILDSTLGLSFVAISNFIFDTNSLVVKPTEEQMQKRFENTKTLHLSIYSILSIEEMGEKPKNLSFKKDRSNLVVIPKDGGVSNESGPNT